MTADPSKLVCPIPIADYPVVTLAHGGGGRLMRQLIDKMFASAHANAWMQEQHDGAVLEPIEDGMLPVLTTDSFVVDPLFFPGGDIGKLAVCGTVNDLAMCGAIPRYLTCAFVIEEGLPMETLWQVVQSMQRTAAEASVRIVTGDTKVVDRGKADKLFVNTAGVGVVEKDRAARPARIRAGDAVVVSGDLGRHGAVVLSTRNGIEFEEPLASDCEPLQDLTRALIDAGLDVHCMRDLTRGGLATAMVELASSTRLDVALDERAIPVLPEVRGVCELLGLDPLYVANEGRFVAVLPEPQADRAVAILRELRPAHGATRIGTFTESVRGRGDVTLRTVAGSDRLVDMLSGEQLPRIC
jgi:hydrogenase expression/formation protein HypE